MFQRFQWLALVLVIGGGYLAWMGWQDRSLHARLDEAGRVVAGTIDSGEVESGRRSRKTHRFAVSYTTEDGKACRRDFEVSAGYFERHVSGEQIVEDAVQVKYDPEDPQRAILVGGAKDQRGMLPIGGAGVGAGVLLGAFLFARRRRAAAVAATGAGSQDAQG
jgi:hypothetical protein